MELLERRCLKCGCVLGFKDAKKGKKKKFKDKKDICVGTTDGICDLCLQKRKVEKLVAVNNDLKDELKEMTRRKEEIDFQFKRWKKICVKMIIKKKIYG